MSSIPDNNHTINGAPQGTTPKSSGSSSDRGRYGMIPHTDMAWVLKQKPSVMTLFLECWLADSYGNRWMQLNTQLKSTAFTEAKKVLSKRGLFVFKPEPSIQDERFTVYWMVKNLHGSRRDNWCDNCRHLKGYKRFLKSDYWKQVRTAVLERDGYQCQKCGAKTELQAHHLSYKHHWDEINHLNDLVTFCENCHAEVHNK